MTRPMMLHAVNEAPLVASIKWIGHNAAAFAAQAAVQQHPDKQEEKEGAAPFSVGGLPRAMTMTTTSYACRRFRFVFFFFVPFFFPLI